jgi:hypothetical protein
MSPGYGHTEGTLPDIGELTGRTADPDAIREDVLRQLGGDPQPPQRREDLPDVTGLREALGGELAP